MDKNKLINKTNYFYNQEKDEEIVRFVKTEFDRRREERRPFDLIWELNMNFVCGNQYCAISPKGEITDSEKAFYWECREVYNHIAPIVETRLAKLNKVRPMASVKPASSEQNDVFCARLSRALLDYSRHKNKLSKLVSEATAWSEVTGTAFYKVVWNSAGGDIIGRTEGKDGNDIFSGDVDISVCPPFEIFPDSLGANGIEGAQSIIHARAVPANLVKKQFGIDEEGQDLDALTLDSDSFISGLAGRSNVTKVTKVTKHNQTMVIEYYQRPDADFPEGRLIIVVGNHLAFDGALPYVTGEGNTRELPFVCQVSTSQVGQFFGSSVVERCIPIQRAYNAIKNRKHEFLSRLAGGVLAVEDGSVDVDELQQDGLAPGKILIYRAGSPIPKFMDAGDVPFDFNREEDRLLNEFITVSGVSELMRDSAVPTAVTSGTALSLLIEQDETRLSVTAEYIREAIKEIARMTLELYHQFATTKRLCQISDDNGESEAYYFTGSDLTCFDIVLDSQNELTESPAQRKSMMIDMFKMGLFHDEDGKLSNRVRFKLLEGLGFGLWDFAQDERQMQVRRADKENLNVTARMVPGEFDDHKIHIEEHKKYLLSPECEARGKEYCNNLSAHIVAHKNMSISDTAFDGLEKKQ